jgi:hypothetical protein
VLLIALTFVLAAFPVIGSAWCFVCAAAWVGTGVLWLSWLIARPRLKFESGQVSPATRDAAKPSLGVRLMPHLYPGWRSFTASALVLTFFAAGRSVPGYYVGRLLFSLALLLVLALIWLFRLVAMVIVARAQLARVLWHTWLIQPVILLFLFPISATSIPQRLTFSLSRGDMDSAAQAVLSGKTDPESIHRVGLFPISEVHRYQGAVTFVIRGAGFLQKDGYCYQKPPHGDCSALNDSSEHYSGPWFEIVRDTFE